MIKLDELRQWFFLVKDLYKSSGYNDAYELNEFWTNDNLNPILNIIKNGIDPIRVIHEIQATTLYQTTTDKSYNAHAIDYQIGLLIEKNVNIFELEDFVQESVYMRGDHVSNSGGRIFTVDFFRYLNAILLINAYRKEFSKRPKVMELGGGIGNFARLYKLFNPESCYIIVDIPETLFFSYIYIKLNFPEKKILLVSSEKDLNSKSTDENDFIFVPTKFAEFFVGEEFDLFVNTASLGEMTNPIIKYWINFLQNKLKPKFQYTLNRYLNILVPGLMNDWRKNENLCSVLYNQNWIIERWQLDPDYMKCPYVFIHHARYLEIFARYNELSLPQECKILSERILDEVSLQDWNREFEIYLHNRILLFHAQLISSNFSTGGTLFKLWNAIRLDPQNKLAVVMMLKFLYVLSPRGFAEFEEYFYYKSLFIALKDVDSAEDNEFVKWLSLRDEEILFKKENITDEKVGCKSECAKRTMICYFFKKIIFKFRTFLSK